MKLDVILRIGVKLILPFLLLFAFYVHFHGDYGPGGGFQAGVMSAAMVILYGLIFGIDAAKRVVPQRFVELLIPIGVLLYVAAGIPAFFEGHRFLDYGVLSDDAVHGRVLGILIIETGVLITVAGTMTAIFYAFAERGRG
jgi:multicomponent Na+:H+ antiporter subunit B